MGYAQLLASKLVILLSVAHTAAYCIYLCENKTLRKLGSSNDEEMMCRILILTGSAILAGLLEFLYQKTEQC